MWQLQVPLEHRAPPGRGTTRIIMLVNRGGTATQPKAPGHDRPLAAPPAARHGRPVAIPRAPGPDVPSATTAEAPGQHRLCAASKAPGHDRPLAAPPAARHGRPVAIPRAPGPDVPSATTAEAPGQHRLRAASKAPGHDRPLAAPPAARHGRPVAIPRAPGADVPPASPAGAPGQHRLRAASKAPGHDRPLAALPAARHGRPVAILKAPGADVPRATTARAPGQHRLCAVAIATAPSPAGLRRPRQEDLPRVPATPNTLTYPYTPRDTAQKHATHAHHLNCHSQFPPHHSRKSMSRPPTRGGQPHPPVATGTPPGGNAPSTRRLSHLSTHHVQPAIQVPPQPRCCSTAVTGIRRQHPARAPPP